MKIATKVVAWELTDETTANFGLYYKAVTDGAQPSFNYEDPCIMIPAVKGQTQYQVQIPGQLPLTEGQYALGLCAFDAEGNGSDFAVLVRFFDFTAPAVPTNFRVL